jgi:hypothetical protein
MDHYWSEVNVVGVMPWLRQLVAGLSPQRPKFAPRSIHMGFVEDRVALGQGFLLVIWFFPVSIIPIRAPYSYHFGDEQ